MITIFEHDRLHMSDPPNIRNAFIAGTALFYSTAFVTAGTYAIFRGHHQQFRYSFFTALNVGTAGGLFLGNAPKEDRTEFRYTGMFATYPWTSTEQAS